MCSRDFLSRFSLTFQTTCLNLSLGHSSQADVIMERAPHDATDAELAVLQVLWDQGPVTVRTITDVIYPKGTASHYGTVQKLLERLEAKRFVSRDRGHWPHVFAAAIDRDVLIGMRLRVMADKLCGGSLTPLMLNLVRAKPLSAGEVAELRALLDSLSRSAGTKRKHS
jgi:predicted transcriptional regulator